MLDIPATPNVSFLTTALRDRSLWPAGFHWDYSDCDECAMGLANLLWPGLMPHRDDETAWARVLNLPLATFHDIFWVLGRRIIKPLEKVTPKDVADALDRVASDQPIVAPSAPPQPVSIFNLDRLFPRFPRFMAWDRSRRVLEDA